MTLGHARWSLGDKPQVMGSDVVIGQRAPNLPQSSYPNPMHAGVEDDLWKSRTIYGSSVDNLQGMNRRLIPDYPVS